MASEIIAEIKKGRNFLITSHVRVDGDALGSELALYLMLKESGKNVVVYNQDDTPENYRFLPAPACIVHELGDVSRFDAAFILDCSDLERVGDEAQKIGYVKTLINIDHHVSNGRFCDLTILDAEASSTGELIYGLMREMSYALTKDICTNLYTAILTDTGGFRYSNTRAAALQAAGDLVASGADPQWISENIYESDPPQKIKLLAKALETLNLDMAQKISSMVVTQKAMQETGASYDHTEGFVDVIRSVNGMEVAVLYSQLQENYFKLSLRSKGKVNVEKVAKLFGGGGHFNAAACRIEGDIEDIKARVARAITESV